MKYKGLILFFIANEASAVTLGMMQQQAMSTMIWGALATVLGLFVLWMFARVGMFRGLKFRHYVFLLTLVLIAAAVGYYLGSV